MTAQPRLVVSAPSSGHGKTAIAVGLLAACAARGVPAAGFKVGPDHTDAAYLGLAAGRPGRNLDPRLVGAQRIAPLFAHGAAGSQLAVIEGAMGLFDSLTGQPEIDGTAAVAASLRAPVVLVVDVAAMGHSVAALVHGFRMFDEMVHLGGVVLNRVASPRHEEMLRTALDDIGMPVLGALRRGDLPNVLPARAHGPVPVAHRTVEASRAVRRLGEAVAECLDLERLLGLANSAPSLPGPIWTPAEAVGGDPLDQRPVIALAGGPGAPYTYVETAELLTAAGADVAVVDPLRDESLPAGTRALVVGAGLPEGYAEELSANRRLCNAVAQFAHDGWPVVAEGVALPWLGRDFDGRPMCAVLDASAYTGDQTVAGYREATAPTTSVLAPGGARITGYKQHRAIVTPRAGVVPAWTWAGGNPEGFVWRQVHASQLGLHWAAAPEIAKRLVAAAIAGPGPAQSPSVVPPQAGMATQPTTAAQPGIAAQTSTPAQQAMAAEQWTAPHSAPPGPPSRFAMLHQPDVPGQPPQRGMPAHRAPGRWAPGQSGSDEASSGRPLSGDADVHGTPAPLGMPAHPVPGRSAPSHPLSGQPSPGQPVVGQPLSEQPPAGLPLPDQPVPGGPLSGQPVPGRPSSVQPVPGQSAAAGPTSAAGVGGAADLDDTADITVR
jgi:cobyrinic acid a,c-diamide synthase